VRNLTWHLGWIAIPLVVAAIVFAAAALPGYSQLSHPIALLGTSVSPRAAGFNLFGFIVPGLIVAGFARVLERELGQGRDRRLFRIGTGLLLIAGLAFAAQGLFALDPIDLDGDSSRRHAATHAIARIAWIAAAVVLAFARWRERTWRIPLLSGTMFAAILLLDLLQPLVAIVPAWRAAPGAIERVLLALWLLWPALLAGCGWRHARRRPS
jgi:hypothetical membrane protein